MAVFGVPREVVVQKVKDDQEKHISPDQHPEYSVQGEWPNGAKIPQARLVLVQKNENAYSSGHLTKNREQKVTQRRWEQKEQNAADGCDAEGDHTKQGCLCRCASLSEGFRK